MPNPSTIPASALDPTAAEFRELVELAVERLEGFLARVADEPVDGTGGDPAASAAFARTLREPLPRRGADCRSLVAELFDRILPHSYATTSPGFMAYVPGGGLLHAAVAELIANAVNRYVGVWRSAPGLVQLEVNVVRWLCEIVGYPDTAFGVLTSGGSLANLWAVVAARAARLDEDTDGAVIYVSDQVHHSVAKAARVAGFPRRAMREIPSDERFRMRLDEVRQRIARDRSAGLRPFLIVGSAGTVNTGAVDDLTALAQLAADEGLWLHVDAAYGGFFMLTERGRRAMRGIERADSIVLDPHKGLFLPYGTGAVLVRDPTTLRRAFQGSASYMPSLQDDHELVDFCEISPELSRECRGLRLWLPIKLLGIEAFGRALDEKLDLAAWATGELRAIDGIEIVAVPQLSIVAFRLARPGLAEEGLAALNQELLRRINASNRVLLTPTVVGGRFVIRICVVSFRTHLDRMRELVELVRDAVEAVGP